MALVVQCQQTAIATEALDHYIAQVGSSFGARAICGSKSKSLLKSVHGPLPEVRFRSESEADKDK